MDLIGEAALRQWLQLSPTLPNMNDPDEMEEWTDLVNEIATDLGFPQGVGFIQEEARRRAQPREEILGSRPETKVT